MTSEHRSDAGPLPGETADPALTSALAAAHRAADAARPAILSLFRAEGLAADNKAGPGAFDPVTEADRAAEAAIREVLASERPADGVLGEEAAATASSSGLTWVVDPIDGTRAFLVGAPTWGVLIGLNDGTRPVLGVMDQPWTRERFWGDGAAAWHARDGEAPRRLRARAPVPLCEARLCSTFPEVGTEAERAAFEQVRDRVRLTRYGLDCTGYALVAAGGVDLVVEAGLQAYDIQALIPIIEGAGGVVTTWDGGDPQQGGRILAAANPQIHAEALAILNA
ncbi:histidinol-phosphatase, inositol monophosphatase family [Albimonas donghaensis]|uniref:Histidinol-phosphatase n=1 Tax=Albimonas donghaensis TaxID=356660 RepID=A0A1H3D1U0_9RHOB|nr:histidinol-phosphatase [Albimonas donghaensis]SDX60335.1 histidinol-phosphatase, inositol monophosphatase family [Albimonas donghaensis]